MSSFHLKQLKNVIVIEKKRKIGEINGENLFVWELYDVIKRSQLEQWCKDRGYGVPYVSDKTDKAEIYYDLEISLWDIDSPLG
jgi:hypothetical protein